MDTLMIAPNTCPKCGEQKPRYRQDQRICRDCYLAQCRRWAKDNLEYITEWQRVKNRQRYYDNLERSRERSRIQTLRWQANNRAQHREYNRYRYWAKWDEIQAKARGRYLSDPKKHMARQRRYMRGRSVQAIERLRLYMRLYQVARRVRLNSGPKIPPDFLQSQNLCQVGKCAGCRRYFSERLKPQIDHILAVSKGGDNSPENLQLLCRSCNSSKGARPEQEWRRRLGELF